MTWYANCPDCKAQHFVRTDAPPFFAEVIQCRRCNTEFEADLAERLDGRERENRLRSEPLEQQPKSLKQQAQSKPAQLERIEETIAKIGLDGCACEGARFGRHGIFCDARQREAKKRGRSVEW